MIKFLVSVFALCCSFVITQAQMFDPNPIRVGSSIFCTDVALEDVDQDGDLDAAFLFNLGPHTVWLNDGAGNLSFTFGTNPRIHVNQIALSDFDLDGDLDFFFDGNAPGWHLNIGAGNFIPFQGGFNQLSNGIALGDINSDSYPDLIIPDQSTSGGFRTKIFLNDQSGGFTLGPALPPTGQERSALFGDIDGDGDLDLSLEGTLWLNDGTGAFTDTGQSLHVGGTFRTWGRTFADLDADGDLDLLVGEVDLGSLVFLNDGVGNFIWTGERLGKSFNLDAADLNVDGFLDVVTSDTINVYLGDGSGIFGAPVQIIPTGICGNGLCGVALGDLNGDGLPDLLSSASVTGHPGYYLNISPNVIDVKVDVRPGACPNSVSVRARGVVAVAIVGEQDFDVSQVDASSVTLEGVPATQGLIADVTQPFNGALIDELSCTELGPDGISDLRFFFDTQQLISALGNVMSNVQFVELNGSLLDGTQIRGEDVLLLKATGRVPGRN